jgi:hypothetical protein
VLNGLKPGERVVTSGSFLVDAETRLNPAAGSIYFGGSGGGKSGPSSVTTRPSTPEDPDAKITASLAQLSAADRREAEAQKICPILPANKLGSMGPPVKLTIEGQSVFLCCEGCKESATENPAATLAKVAASKGKKPAEAVAPAKPPAATAPSAADKKEAKIQAAFAKLPEADRKLAESQKFCAVLEDSRLGSMGPPIKLMLDGQPVFICCEGCREEALANPQATLVKLRQRAVK